MKRVFLASVALMALTGAAAAADLPPAPAPYYKAPYAAPYYNWTGFYLGVNGGGGFGRSTWDSTGSFNLTGALAGGTIGYNYQYGRAVIGAEGDIDWSGMKGSTTAGCAAGCQTSDSWLSTVRARLGYAADRFLPYVTGGAAFGNIQASTTRFCRQQHDQCGLDGGRRHRIRHRRQLDRQGGISLRRPRQLQLRPRLRSGRGEPRVVQRQYPARRLQLPLLICDRPHQRNQDKAPRDIVAGRFVCGDALCCARHGTAAAVDPC